MTMYTNAVLMLANVDDETMRLALAAIKESEAGTPERYDHFNAFMVRVVDDLLLPPARSRFESRCATAATTDCIEIALEYVSQPENTDDNHFRR